MDKKIIVGSLNKTKVEAIRVIFPRAKIEQIAAPSKVLQQPISNEMTRTGAVNRALYSIDGGEADYGIGLEGGVTFINEQLYLCNWGALVTSRGKIYTASGGLIPLPEAFIEPILQGEELAKLMEKLTKRSNIRSSEGAIGIFTNNLLTRQQLYMNIGTLLKGQLQYQSDIISSKKYTNNE